MFLSYSLYLERAVVIREVVEVKYRRCFCFLLSPPHLLHKMITVVPHRVYAAWVG